MGRSTVELDFFSMEKEATAPKLPPVASKTFERRRSFRDIQGMISKINPEVLKNLIASASAEKKPAAPVTSFSADQKTSLSLPVFTPVTSNCTTEKDGENGPMTIFYNGTVAVYNVSPNKVAEILRLAEGGNSETSHGDLPITRRKSLERFLEKRKERLTMVSPYRFPPEL